MPNHLNFTYLLATGKIPILMDIDVHQMTSRHQINTSPSLCRLDRQFLLPPSNRSFWQTNILCSSISPPKWPF